jgi:hypothetical protein
MTLESNELYKKYENLKMSEFMPGHIRADLHGFTTLSTASREIIDWLLWLHSVSQTYWSGRFVPIAKLLTDFPSEYTLTSTGAGEASHDTKKIIYTEAAVPSGVFVVDVGIPEFHSLILYDGWLSLSNQDAAVIVRLDLVDQTVENNIIHALVSESLDDGYRRWDEEGVQYHELQAGYASVIRMSGTAEIDADSVCESYLLVQVI